MKYFFILSIITLGFIACNEGDARSSFVADQPIQADSFAAACPYLTKDAAGNTLLSWVRLINDSTSAFCYAISRDGRTFGAPIVIPNSQNIQPHGENLPKIVVKPSGEILALWGVSNANPANKYSGLVYYTQSFDEGKTWSAARPLVTDTSSYDQRYYDVALLPNGEAGVIWLDNRKKTTKEGSALYFASTNGKKGFENERLVSQPCCPCCRTDLFVDKSGGIHALFRGILQDSIRDMVHTVSTDGGKTFSTPKRISHDNWVLKGCPHTGPAMTENSNGIHFTWFTGGKTSGSFYTASTDNGKTFKMPDNVSGVGSHPQLTSLPGGELVIVWDEMETKNKEVYKKIGLQKRNADGKKMGTIYITPSDAHCSFPVVAAASQSTSFVAYTRKLGDKTFIKYQLVK